MGENLTLEEVKRNTDPVSFCGHHCTYCFLAADCGGCRTDMNYCSYAGAFEDKKCPNVECCREKGIDGCYECDDLFLCKKGYYENENKNEYVAKATALFIKKYGKECYTAALKKAIDCGENYPKSFDEAGSVENALVLLEKYL